METGSRDHQPFLIADSSGLISLTSDADHNYVDALRAAQRLEETKATILVPYGAACSRGARRQYGNYEGPAGSMPPCPPQVLERLAGYSNRIARGLDSQVRGGFRILRTGRNANFWAFARAGGQQDERADVQFTDLIRSGLSLRGFLAASLTCDSSIRSAG